MDKKPMTITPPDFGVDLRARTMSGTYPSSKSLRLPKANVPTHVSVNAKGERSLHTDFLRAVKSQWGQKGSWVETHPKGEVVWAGPYGETKKVKETFANSVAKELKEAWWCGTPALEAHELAPATEEDGEIAAIEKALHKGTIARKATRKALDWSAVEKPPATTNQPDKAKNWSVNAVDKPVTEASLKAGKASKSSKTKTTRHNRVPDAANEDPAMLHAKKIMKMANCVASSVHASPLGILAAEYAKHTFHPSNIGESKAEQIVDKFIEDTTTGDVAGLALGFAPVGMLAKGNNPDISNPGGKKKKKKKKKSQFQRLSDEMSGKGNRANMEDSMGGARSMYSRLARKVAGNMSGV